MASLGLMPPINSDSLGFLLSLLFLAFVRLAVRPGFPLQIAIDGIVVGRN
jgi:hypothetical protein